SVLTKTTSFRVCINAAWVDERSQVQPSQKFLILNHRGKLRTVVTLEVLDAAGSDAGQVLARATGSRTGTEETICTDTTPIYGTEPGEMWTTCDASTEAPAVATKRWDSISSGHTYTWTPLTAAGDTELQEDVNTVLEARLAT